MFCKQCGADAGDNKYCPNCGSAVDGASGESSTYKAEPVVNGKRVNKVAYGVLAILIGDFGIHKFYGGRIGLGIIYLIFFWTFIPGILGLIEGILALCKQSDPDGCIVIPKDKFFA